MKLLGLILVCAFMVGCATTTTRSGCEIKENEHGFHETNVSQVGRAWTSGISLGFGVDDKGPLLVSQYIRNFANSNTTTDNETPLTLQFMGNPKIVLEPLSQEQAKRTFVGWTLNTKKITSAYRLTKQELHQLVYKRLTGVTMTTKVSDELTTDKYSVKEDWARSVRFIGLCFLNSDELAKVSTK